MALGQNSSKGKPKGPSGTQPKGKQGATFLKPGFLRHGFLRQEKNKYEMERDEKVAENNAYLQSLGLKGMLGSKSTTSSTTATVEHLEENDPEYEQEGDKSDDDLSGSEFEGGDGLNDSESEDLPVSGRKRKAPSAVTTTEGGTTSSRSIEATPSADVVKSLAENKRRGPTSGKWVRKFIKDCGDVQISVPVPEELNALCGNNAPRAAHYLGMLIRRQCRIRNTLKWRHVDPATQSVIIMSFLERFQISDDYHNDPRAQIVLHKKCYNIHKDWWFRMKDHYKKVKEEGGDPYSNKHADVNSDDDWRYMIDEVWNSKGHKT